MLTAPSTYRTVQGDTVDQIAWRLYGSEHMAAAILDANRQLSTHPAVLPAGLVLVLPPKITAPQRTWSLW